MIDKDDKLMNDKCDRRMLQMINELLQMSTNCYQCNVNQLLLMSISSYQSQSICYCMMVILIIGYNGFNKMNLISDYAYPPDLAKSKIHRQATRIFKTKPQANLTQYKQKCECCNQLIGQQQIQRSCCYQADQLQVLGPGVPLFFLFIQNAIMLLFVMLVSFGCFGIYSNLKASDCQVDCSPFSTLSLLSKIDHPHFLNMQNNSILIFMILAFLFFLYVKYENKQYAHKFDTNTISPSDYAIILRHLPPDVTEEMIMEMVENRKEGLLKDEKFESLSLRVNRIIFGYVMKEYVNVKNKNLQNFKNHLKEQLPIEDFNHLQLPTLDEYSTIAIVTFTKIQSKKYFLSKPSICDNIKRFLMNPLIHESPYKVNGHCIGIERAPQPIDLIWQNGDYELIMLIKKKVKYGLYSLGILVLGGGIQCGIEIARVKISNKSIEDVLIYLSSLLIVLTNFIISKFMVYTSIREKNLTKTEFYTSLTFKISFLQFLNAGLFLAFAKLLLSSSSFELSSAFSEQITLFMLLNAFGYNIGNYLLNRFQIPDCIWRSMLQNGKMVMTQKQANKLFEGPQSQVSHKYAYIIKTLWLTAFYSPFVPVVIPISIVGLIMNYIMEKSLYNNIYSSKSSLSDLLNTQSLKLMEMTSIILVIGQAFFLVIGSNNQNDYISWLIVLVIAFIISLLHHLVPVSLLYHEEVCNSNEEVTYNQAKIGFENTYQSTNPALNQGNQLNEPSNKQVFEALMKANQQKYKFREEVERAQNQKWKKSVYYPLQQENKAQEMLSRSQYKIVHYPKAQNLRYFVGQPFSKVIQKKIRGKGDKQSSINLLQHEYQKI